MIALLTPQSEWRKPIANGYSLTSPLGKAAMKREIEGLTDSHLKVSSFTTTVRLNAKLSNLCQICGDRFVSICKEQLKSSGPGGNANSR
jgi:hypothetical protein